MSSEPQKLPLKRGDAASAKSSLTRLCYNEIRDRILLSYYRGNQILLEGALAQEFGISKTPVREALSLLVHDRMLRVVPRVGYKVTTVSVEEVHEVYEVRVLLEGHSAALAASAATDLAISEWMSDLELRSRLLESRDAGLREYLKFDEAVHMGIAALSGNRVLARIINQLLREAIRLSTTSPLASIANLHEEAETRESLIAAMRQHDAVACKELMRRHLLDWKNHVLETIRCEVQESPDGPRVGEIDE